MRLLLTLYVCDKERFTAWVKSLPAAGYVHMVMAFMTTLHPHSHLCSVFLRRALVDDVVGAIQLFAHNAVGVETIRLNHNDLQSSLRTLAQLGELTYKQIVDTVKGVDISDNPFDNVYLYEPPIFDGRRARRGVRMGDLKKTLLASVGLILDREAIVGSCMACANDAEFAAQPCEDLVYCASCVARHLSCEDLVGWCPVCNRADATFEKV